MSIPDEALDRMTKPLLIAEVSRLQKAADDRAKAVERIPEADALAGCVRSLSGLKVRSNTYNSTDVPDVSTIDRILRHLASKFSIGLVEVKTEPCNRPHLDSINTHSLTQAMQDAMYQAAAVSA